MNILIKKIVFLLCLCLPFFVFGATSVKLNDNTLTPEKVMLTVAIEDVGYFPFNYTENGEPVGFSVDILNYFSAHSNYTFEYIIQPWPRAISLVAQGKVDLILTLFKTFQREETYHIIEPAYGFEINQLFTLVDKNLEFSGELQQLAPYSIGTLRAYSYGKAFDQSSFLKKYPTTTEDTLVKLLVGNRVDAIIGNPYMFNRIAEKKDVASKIKAIKPYISLTPVHMALTKKIKNANKIKRQLEQLTRQLKSSTYYQELLNKYKLNFKQ